MKNKTAPKTPRHKLNIVIVLAVVPLWIFAIGLELYLRHSIWIILTAVLFLMFLIIAYMLLSIFDTSIPELSDGIIKHTKPKEKQKNEDENQDPYYKDLYNRFEKMIDEQYK